MSEVSNAKLAALMKEEVEKDLNQNHNSQERFGFKQIIISELVSELWS
jgi:hypothetical protein